jgi:hypothetical protein
MIISILTADGENPAPVGRLSIPLLESDYLLRIIPLSVHIIPLCIYIYAYIYIYIHVIFTISIYSNSRCHYKDIYIPYIQVPSFTQITAAVAVRTGTPQGPSGDGHRSTSAQAVGNAEPLKGA